MIPVSEFAIRVNSTSQVQPVLNVQLRMERVVHYMFASTDAKRTEDQFTWKYLHHYSVSRNEV